MSDATILSMLLPFSVALTLKFLWWLVAAALFLRLLSGQTGPVDAPERRRLGAGLLGALGGSKLVFILTFPVFLISSSGIADPLLALASENSLPGAVIGGRLAIWWADRTGAGASAADRLVRPI